jgi:hypothetical protein
MDRDMTRPDDLPERVELTRVEAIGIARILWEVLGTEGVNHDLQMRAMEYALALDTRALLPSWPSGAGRDEVIDHLRRVQQIVERRLAELDE